MPDRIDAAVEPMKGAGARQAIDDMPAYARCLKLRTRDRPLLRRSEAGGRPR